MTSGQPQSKTESLLRTLISKVDNITLEVQMLKERLDENPQKQEKSEEFLEKEPTLTRRFRNNRQSLPSAFRKRLN
jgi:DNA repair ATPase RecN